MPGKEQDGLFVGFQAFPEVVRVGLGDAAALAILSWRDRRELDFAVGDDIAIACLQRRVLPGNKACSVS